MTGNFISSIIMICHVRFCQRSSLRHAGALDPKFLGDSNVYSGSAVDLTNDQGASWQKNVFKVGPQTFKFEKRVIQGMQVYTYSHIFA